MDVSVAAMPAGHSLERHDAYKGGRVPSKANVQSAKSSLPLVSFGFVKISEFLAAATCKYEVKRRLFKDKKAKHRKDYCVHRASDSPMAALPGPISLSAPAIPPTSQPMCSGNGTWHSPAWVSGVQSAP